jgi:serine/threonine protein phosphatase PrpC
MTIGEFSARSGLSPKRLRTYADVALLVPVAVDAASGYRYYAADQLYEARLIDALRAAGMPLGEIARFLRDPTCDRLDGWAGRVEAEAADRHRAVDRARVLLSTGSASCSPVEHGRREKEPTMKLRTVSHTETGLVRATNEDAVVGDDQLVAVADGMGGAPGGATASAVAATLVRAAFTGRSLDELAAGVRAANRALWDRASADPEMEGMGTTISAAGVTTDGTLALVNVGDSRVCRFRDGALTQLTEDHSVTAELVRSGELDHREARAHPQHSILTRALGVGPEVQIDATTHPAVTGDRLLVATDGLFNEIPNQEIQALMASTVDLEATVAALIGLAMERGAHDNVSVVVADVIT